MRPRRPLAFLEGPQSQLAPAPRTSSNSIYVSNLPLPTYLFKSAIRALLSNLFFFLIKFGFGGRLGTTTHALIIITVTGSVVISFAPLKRFHRDGLGTASLSRIHGRVELTRWFKLNPSGAVFCDLCREAPLVLIGFVIFVYRTLSLSFVLTAPVS